MRVKHTNYIIYRGMDHLEHHGILGQKWGVRRFQNPDGTLTEEGKARYLTQDDKQSRENEQLVKSKFRRSYVAQASKNEYGALSRDQKEKAEQLMPGEKKLRILAQDKEFALSDHYGEIDWDRKQKRAALPIVSIKAMQAFYDAMYDTHLKRDELKREFINEALARLDKVKKEDRELAEAYVHDLFTTMERRMKDNMDDYERVNPTQYWRV